MEREILINQIAIMKALMSLRPGHNAHMTLQERIYDTENILKEKAQGGPIRMTEKPTK